MFFNKNKQYIDNKKLAEAYSYISKTYSLFYDRTGKPTVENNPKESALIGITNISLLATIAGEKGFESVKNNEFICHGISVRVDFINGKNNSVTFPDIDSFLNQTKKWYQQELSKHENSNSNTNL